MNRPKLLRNIYWVSVFLATTIAVFLVSVVFLNPSSVGNPHFVRNINLWAVIWAINFVFVLVLSFILARNLIKLFFEYRANRPGSRIKTKLVITLITFSLVPALIMSFLAFGLINQNLRQWFSAPSEQLLDSSQLIARSYYEKNQDFQFEAAQSLARQIKDFGLDSSTQLEQLSRDYGFVAILFLGPEKQVLHQDNNWGESLPSQPVLDQVLEGQRYYSLRREIKTDHGVVGVPFFAEDSSVGALFGRFSIPESVTFHAIQVEEASKKYEAIKGGVSQLRLNYFSILGVTTLTVVLGFLWLGTYIAKKITVPLEALVEGARELAEGNLDHRVDANAVDELGILIDSFNRMGEEIKQNREKLESTNDELRETNIHLDERRSYIETILQNIATGVISVDKVGVIHAVNEAALKMLQVSRENFLNKSIQEATNPSLHKEFLALIKRADLYGTYRKEITFKLKGRQLHVAATITSNPVPLKDKSEYLIVLDDLTELIKAEKFVAWQEVAKRLAHEIKNPLTPIQLSAERVNKQFEKIVQKHASSQEILNFQKLLGEAMQIIAAEAEILRKLVEEFSKFARLPICKPTPVQFHHLIEETLALYDSNFKKVEIRKNFDSRIDEIRVDREQMQRVFINLIDNSLDALAESEASRRISVRTHLNAVRKTITVQIEDNGNGIAPQDYEHLFLPYFSTKKKGTGLGLAIVRQIISEHKGFVRAEPNLPRGTRFTMEIPA